MSERIRIIHNALIAGTQVEYKAEIIDDEYGGSVEEKIVSNRFFDLEYDQIDEKAPFENPVQKSTFSINLIIEDDAELTLLTDILDSDEDRFQINFYIDDSLTWSGKVLNDLIEYPEADYPITSTIKAKDLSSLEGVDSPSADATVFRGLSVLIADCLKLTGLTLNIRSFTNLTNSEVTQANDFLFEIHHMREAFETQGGVMSCLEALQNICRAYNLIIRQSGGRWIIEQLPAVAKGDATQFDYDSDGLNPTSSTPSRTQTIDGTDSYILPSSKNIVTGALKRIDSVYNHKTLIHNIDTDDVTYTDGNNFGPGTFLFSFENKPTYHLFFTADVEVDTDAEELIEGTAYLQVRGFTSSDSGVSNQYLTNAGTWSSTAQDIEIDMTGTVNGQMSGSFSVADSGGFSIAVEQLIITFKFADAQGINEGPSHPVTEVRWRNINAYIFNSEILDLDASLRHRYTRTGDYSVTEDIGTTVLGDGPATGTNTASIGRPASGSLASTVLEPGTFRIRGVSENLTLEEITLRERVNMRRSALRNLRANMWINYSPENLISYRSETWFFSGGYFSAKRSRWTANIIQLSYDGDTTGDTFTEIVESGGDPTGTSTGTPGTGGGLSEAEANNLYFRQDNNLSEGDASAIRSTLNVLEAGTGGAQIRTNTQLDGHYGRLASANTWTDINTFAGTNGRFQTKLANATGGGTSLSEWRVLNADDSMWTRIGKQSSSDDIFDFGDRAAADEVSVWRFLRGNLRFDGDLLAGASTVIDSSANITARTASFSNDAGGGSGVVSFDANVTSGYTYSTLLSDTGIEINSNSASRPYILKVAGTERFRVHNTGASVTGIFRSSDQVIVDEYVATLKSITSDFNHLRLANDSGTVFGVIGLEASTGDIYIGTDTKNKALIFDRSQTGDAQFDVNLRFNSSLLAGANVVINSNRDYFGRDGTFSRNLFVEGGLFAKEFVVDTTRSLSSTRMSPTAGGKVGEITDATVGSEKVIFHDENDDPVTPFSDDDLVLIQVRSGVNSGTIIKSIKRVVVADSQPSNVVSLTTTGATTGTDVGTIAVGDQAVHAGNISDATRDHYIDFRTANINIPEIGFLDSVSDFDGGNEIVRLGGLSGFSGVTGSVGIAGNVNSTLAFELSETRGMIADFEFEVDSGVGHFYRESTAGDFTGLQSGGGDDVRAIFAGADDKTGANATFYVRNDGNIFHPAIGGSAFNSARLADFTDNASTGALESWSTVSSVSVTSGNQDTEDRTQQKVDFSYRHRQGINTLRLSGQRSRETTSGGDLAGSLHTAEIIFDVDVLNNTESFTNSSFSAFTMDIDVSGLTAGNFYTVKISTRAHVFAESAGGSGSASTTTNLREDISVIALT